MSVQVEKLEHNMAKFTIQVADEDFEKVVEDFLKTLKFTEYTSATGAFTVKKVYYPETTS